MYNCIHFPPPLRAKQETVSSDLSFGNRNCHWNRGNLALIFFLLVTGINLAFLILRFVGNMFGSSKLTHALLAFLKCGHGEL